MIEFCPSPMADSFPVTPVSHFLSEDLICLSAPVQDLAHTLSNTERTVIRNAVEKRRREYATGRWLAHRALAGLGIFVDSIPTGPKREPVWPEPVLGSITHTDGQVAVAVTNDPNVVGVGIDLERAGRVDEPIMRRILTERERSRLGSMDPTLVFSAKESCYKALFPVFREYVEFQAVEVELDEADSRFSLSYVGECPAHAVIEQARGSFQQVGDCWFTCVILPSIGEHELAQDVIRPV